MLTGSRLLSALTAAVVLLLMSPPGVQAAPRPKPATNTMSPPYADAGTFTSYTYNCERVTTTCATTGSADSTTGRSVVASSYGRSSPLEGGGYVRGRTIQEVPFTVPKSAQQVTAVVTYRVDAASASVVGTPYHLLWAQSGVIGGFGEFPSAKTVASTNLTHPSSVTEPYTDTFTAFSSGPYPPTLVLRIGAYADIRGAFSGCLGFEDWEACHPVSHAGTAQAKIDVTILSVRFDVS